MNKVAFNLMIKFGYFIVAIFISNSLVWTASGSEKGVASEIPKRGGELKIGMLLTPPDVISQTILAIPVYLLYELGIIMSKLLKSRPVK